MTIQRELAVAYVALDRPDLAIEAFVAALDRQPELALDSRDTSPTVQASLQSARDARAEREAAEAAAEEVVDGGVPDASDAPEGE